MSTPDWQVAIIDGQPEVMVNAAAIARMACNSPLGIVEAMKTLERNMPPAAFKKVEDELRIIAFGKTGEAPC